MKPKETDSLLKTKASLVSDLVADIKYRGGSSYHSYNNDIIGAVVTLGENDRVEFQAPAYADDVSWSLSFDGEELSGKHWRPGTSFEGIQTLAPARTVPNTLNSS